MNTESLVHSLSRTHLANRDNIHTQLVSALRAPVDKLLGLEAFAKIYGDLRGCDSHTFALRFLLQLGVSYTIPQDHLERIPQEGPIIVVANHPYGCLDGLLLANILLSRRNDAKIMANYLLGCVPELRDLLLLVDPYAQADSSRKNRSGLRAALSHLGAGGAIGLFPAGDVARLGFLPLGIHEGAWPAQVARIAKHAQATVVPVYFDGGNSKLFHLLGLIHPKLRTLQFPREMLSKQGQHIRVEIGAPIPPARLERLGSDENCMRYLRTRCLFLHNRVDTPQPQPKTSNFNFMEKSFCRAKIIEPVPAECMEHEIQNLPAQQILLENNELYAVYAQGEQIPRILREISRLREYTFRLVGEGTGAACDTDAFDKYYTHLFIWNRERKEVVGAYRLAQSDEVIKRMGPGGMYTTTLFQLAPDFFNRLGPALELGRSFVRPEYQKSYTPLLLLWKGIACYLQKHPRYTTLFGPVSITNDYKEASRQLMVSFFEHHNQETELTGMVKPRTPFKRTAWARALMQNMPDDEAELDSLLCDIEGGKGLPVLIRQYLKLGASILQFNVDPAFSNSLDGLIVVNLLKTDKRQLERYMGKAAAAEFLACHASASQSS